MAKMEEVEWLLDSVLAFLKSPTYTVPVMDFIDEKCIVFDGEEENKMIHNDVHKQFIDLVFNLLEAFLDELGITQEEFAKACETGINSGGDNAFVFQQIMAVEDFNQFKRMMVKRNLELQHEALRAIQKQAQAAASEAASALDESPAQESAAAADAAAPSEAGEEDNEEAELQEALRLSKKSFAEDSELEDKYLQEALRISREEAAEALAEEERQLQEALRLSEQAELERLELERERAELDHARALREVLDEERKRLDAASEAASAAAAPAADSSSSSAPAAAAAAPAAAAAAGGDGGSLSSLALPPISRKLTEQELELRQQAASRLAKEQEALVKRQEENERKRREVDAQRSEMDQEQSELEQRKAYLRAQRDKLVELKKAERENKKKSYEEAQQRLREETKTELLASLEPTLAPAASKESELTAEERRLEMRRLIAQRLKQDMVVQEERRAVGEDVEETKPDEERERQRLRMELMRREAALQRKD